MSSFVIDIVDILLALFPWSKRKRDRQQEWSGTVEAKRAWTLSEHAYLVIFRTGDGEKKKVRMDKKEDFDSYEKGRRYLVLVAGWGGAFAGAVAASRAARKRQGAQ